MFQSLKLEEIQHLELKGKVQVVYHLNQIKEVILVKNYKIHKCKFKKKQTKMRIIIIKTNTIKKI